MALRALRECGHIGCRELSRNSRCERHQREKGRGTSRNRPGDPFYSSPAWRRLRAAKLAEDPLCEDCLERGLTTAATEVDHIIDRCDRPDLALVKSNLSSKCKSDHSRKTAKTMAKRRRGKRNGGTGTTSEADSRPGS
jgi:5-methylcytosine-specific restriction protein A